MGLPEIADRLLGHPLFKSSVAIKFIQLNAKENRPRVLKPQKNSEDGQASAEVLPNMIDQYYPARPDDMEDICLFTMLFNAQYVAIIYLKCDVNVSVKSIF